MSACCNYRRYNSNDQQRLERTCFYRSAGLKLADIHTILDDRKPASKDLAAILEGRLQELNGEIETRREQQTSGFNHENRQASTPIPSFAFISKTR